MDQTYQRHGEMAQSQRVLEMLTREQHLHPHRPLLEAIEEAAGDIGFCAEAGQRAVDGLHLDGQVSIGRIGRAQLTALASLIDRYWRQADRVSE